MKLCGVLGMLGFSAMAVAGPLELERELNNLNVDVEVSELETHTGSGIEAGRVQVLVANHEHFKVACQLHPGDTESSPGLDSTPITIVEPAGRRALTMSGEYGDSTLNALLTCARDE
jgi:hypothetical protein